MDVDDVLEELSCEELLELCFKILVDIEKTYILPVEEKDIINSAQNIIDNILIQ